MAVFWQFSGSFLVNLWQLTATSVRTVCLNFFASFWTKKLAVESQIFQQPSLHFTCKGKGYDVAARFIS